MYDQVESIHLEIVRADGRFVRDRCQSARLHDK
jgi:hypothetical protein